MFMKKFLFLFVLLSLVVVSCKNPVINQIVYEDKSPFEYKMPSNVNLNDYRLAGEFIFSDKMDFTQWKYSNGTAFSQYGYFMVFQKVSRVKLIADGTAPFRKDPETKQSCPMYKGTRYNVYLKKDFIDSFDCSTSTVVLNVTGVDDYDGSEIKITCRKFSDYEYYFHIYDNTKGTDYAYKDYMDINQ